MAVNARALDLWPEQQLLRRLGVCAGGFSLELAEQLASEHDVVALLERLIDQSLVQRTSGLEGEPRFSLLETIHEYALERLIEHGEEPAVRHAHAHCLRTLAERAAPELQRHDQGAWLDRLELEQDNLRGALAWAQEHDVETALRLVAALVAARQGLFAMHRGDDRLAQRSLEQSCAELRVAGNLSQLAIHLLHLGTTLLRLGDAGAARACFDEASELALALKDRHLQGLARNNLGELARVCGDYTAAEHYSGSLRLLQNTDRRSEIPRLLHNLGYVALRAGDTRAAIERFRRSLDLFHPQQPRGVAEVIGGLAAVATVRGAPLLAAKLWGAAAATRERLHVTSWLPDQMEQAHYGALARSACDPEAFSSAWSAGHALTLEQALVEVRALDPL